MVPVGPPIPTWIKVRMFMHGLRCKQCGARFWAAVAMEYSTKALMALTHSPDGVVPLRAKVHLWVANFASRRRINLMRELGIVPFEDLTEEQQAAAIKEINEAGRRAFEAHQRSLH